MSDMGKVIKGLECIANENGGLYSDCPYYTCPYYAANISASCCRTIARDALASLRSILDAPAVATDINALGKLTDEAAIEHLHKTGWMQWHDREMFRPPWISVKERLPEEHESIFHKFLGTPKWSSAMWQQESDKVLVCVSFPDGTSVVTTGCLHNSDWVTTVSKALPQTVTHWMPLPEPPEEEKDA